MNIFQTLVSISGFTWIGIIFALVGLLWALVYGIKVFGLTVGFFGNVPGAKEIKTKRRKLFRWAGLLSVAVLGILVIEIGYFFLFNSQYEYRRLQQLIAGGVNLYAFPFRLIVAGGIVFFILHPLLLIAKRVLNEKHEKFLLIWSLEPDIPKDD